MSKMIGVKTRIARSSKHHISIFAAISSVLQLNLEDQMFLDEHLVRVWVSTDHFYWPHSTTARSGNCWECLNLKAAVLWYINPLRTRQNPASGRIRGTPPNNETLASFYRTLMLTFPCKLLRWFNFLWVGHIEIAFFLVTNGKGISKGSLETSHIIQYVWL